MDGSGIQTVVLRRVGCWPLAAMAAVLAAVSATGSPVDGGTYAALFDRALGLTPGETRVALELRHVGQWEVLGGRRLEAEDGVAVAAASNRVDLIWRGACERAIPLRLQGSVAAAVALRVQPHVLRDGRFDRHGDPLSIAAGPRPASLAVAWPEDRFGGFKLTIEGAGLAGTTMRLVAPRLLGEYQEGWFRREVVLPPGEIWEAVAEVGNTSELYVNGRRVEDETIVRPRPVPNGPAMYHSRRVPLAGLLRPGRNVLGLGVRTGRRTAYLRGSVVLRSGERVVLDSGTNWVWSREAPAGWSEPGFDAAGWLPVGASRLAADGALAHSVNEAGGKSVLGYRPPGSLPCYDGLVKLRNPADAKLFFDARQPFRLEALIPPGLAAGAPVFEWELHRFEDGGAWSRAAAGRAAGFAPSGGSLSAWLAAPAPARGVYALTGRLRVRGVVVEERDPEPVMAVGPVPMRTSAGDAWEQDLDLALETIVDFTNPADPRPWAETDNRHPIPRDERWGPGFYHTLDQPLIVERGGLKYRVTRPVERAQFSYRLEFAHPGDWYLLALEYPDDAERWIGVSCNAGSRMSPPPADGREIADGGNKCGPAIWTGGKYPTTGRMLEMKWLYRPDPGGHSINVMSLMKDTEAAAARLRLYRIAGRLPALDVGARPVGEQRRFGMLTERTFPWGNGIHTMFSAFAAGETPGGAQNRGDMGAGRRGSNAVWEACAQLGLLEDASSHYAEYLRFAGQNLHVMGCYQYNDANTASQFLPGDPRLDDSSEAVLARVLQANDLPFYASVEFASATRRHEIFSSSRSAIQDPALYFADRAGATPAVQRRGFTPGLNFMHPVIEGDMLEVARQLAEQFKHQSRFLGLNWTAFFGGSWLPSYRGRGREPDPLALGYDDFTVGLFERETGARVPGAPGAAGRFEQRYQALAAGPLRPRWLAWRAAKLADFFGKISRVVRGVRPDLECVAGCYLGWEHIAEWKRQGLPFEAFLGQWGWAPDAFRDLDGVWLMPWLHAAARYQSAFRTPGYALAWQGNQDPGFYGPFAGLDRRALMLCVSWHEVERVAAHIPWRPGWPRPFQQTMMGQQREEFAMEPYTQALIGFDPQMIMMGFTDAVPYIGVEGMQRRFARVLRRLPCGRFDPVLGTGFDSNLALRALRADNSLWFYVANPGYWPIRGTVTLAGAARVTDLVSGRHIPLRDGTLAVSLEPFGVAAYRAENGQGQAASGKGAEAVRGQGSGERVEGGGRSPTTSMGSGPSEGSVSAGSCPSGVCSLASGVCPPAADPALAAWSTEPVPDSELAHLRGILDRARAAAAEPEMAGFLGPADYGVLTGAVERAGRALAERRYAAAWAALTEAAFWTVAFQKAPERRVADNARPREVVLANWGSGLAPAIDGVLEDRIWGPGRTEPYAARIGHFVTADKQYSGITSTVRLARSGDRLFLAFEFEDPDPARIRGTANPADPLSLWSAMDDTAVVFLKPPEGDAYYQFAVSANGTRFSQKNSPAGRDYAYAPAWTAAVGRTPTGWTVEMEVDTAEAFGQRLAEGQAWKINVHRQFRLDEHPKSSWTWSARWHDMEQMGILRLAPRAP